jgi:hypothetical protein
VADGQKPTDLVVSYVVSHSGTVPKTTEQLDAALAKGYRVVDVQTTPVETASSMGYVCVTVVLMSNEESTRYVRT